MGTRYQKGDHVKITKGRQKGKEATVIDIRNPESDSPTYIVEKENTNLHISIKASALQKTKNEDIRKELFRQHDRWADYQFCSSFTSIEYLDGVHGRQNVSENREVTSVAITEHAVGVNGLVEFEDIPDTKDSAERKASEELGGSWKVIDVKNMRSYEAELGVERIINGTVNKTGASDKKVIDVFEKEFEEIEDDMTYSVTYSVTSGTIYIVQKK